MISMFALIAVETENLETRGIISILKPLVKFCSVVEHPYFLSVFSAVIAGMVYCKEKRFSFAATMANISSVSHDGFILKAVVIFKTMLSVLRGIIFVPFGGSFNISSCVGMGGSIVFNPFLRADSPLFSILRPTFLAAASVKSCCFGGIAALRTSFYNHGIAPVIESITYYGNQINFKAQRLVGNDVEPSGSKRLAPRTGDDIVCSRMKVRAAHKAAKVSRTLVNIKVGNQWGISCGKIWGVQKVVFNSVDYGCIAIETAATVLATS